MFLSSFNFSRTTMIYIDNARTIIKYLFIFFLFSDYTSDSLPPPFILAQVSGLALFRVTCATYFPSIFSLINLQKDKCMPKV